MSLHDDERDAWLAQALRHAPDANVDAPLALSDAILHEARSAAMPRAAASAAPRPDSTGPLQWLASAWRWLARPPVAAGFASVMVATLVGVMWWDRPLDESLPRAPEVVSQAPQTPQARAEAEPPAAVAAAPAAPEVQATPAESATPKTADVRRESAARGRLAEKKEAASKEAKKDEPMSRATDAPQRKRSAADAAPAVAAAAPPPAAFPAAVPAPAPQAAATANEVPSQRAAWRERAAPATKAATESSSQAAADTAAAPRSDVRALQGSAGPAPAKARAADAADSPLTSLRARIAHQSERWRWQRGTGSAQAMNGDVQGWLSEVDRLARQRWQAGAGNAVREPANTLRLFREGVLQATLGLAGSAVWFEAPGTSAPAASLAPLPENAADSLRKTLDEATP